jgi:hypothetical protein
MRKNHIIYRGCRKERGQNPVAKKERVIVRE